MLVVESLVIDDGRVYPKVFFEGSKSDLVQAIEKGSVITFTMVLANKTIELNVSGSFIVSYDTEITQEELDLPKTEGVQIIIFPTAKFAKL
jgi:hypothetical protein